MSALIAIVGRPNVGKSAIFNRIAGRRLAIVHDEPGVTRDRITAEAEWQGRVFTLVDTGGIGLLRGQKTDDVILQAALAQAEIAIESSAVIFFVVNVQDGIVALDREVADRLRRCGKPVFVLVNKVDSHKAEPAVAEFTALGFKSIYPVSAIHGLGITPVMEAALELIPQDAPATGAEDQPGDAESGEKDERKNASGPLKIAIVGRPNVGKSSIINALTRSERVIVSAVPGTTRDSVDVPFEVDTDGVRQQYILIDTAGVRQERRVDNSIEFYSVNRTEASIQRCDIAIFVIDAEAGVTAQDKKVAGKILEAGKACVLVVNKWDLVEPLLAEAMAREPQRRSPKENRRHGKSPPATLAEFGNWVQDHLFFLDFAPVIFTSAKTGFHLERLLEAIRYVAAQLKQSVPTSILNRTLNDAITRRQPVSASGAHLRFFYATQVRQAPPTFLLFVNKDELFSDQYNKYLSGELRKAFGYEGCPIILVPRARPKTIEPKRRFKAKETAEPGRPKRTRQTARDKGLARRRPFKTPRRPGAR
jgi:GTP-binding protein